MIYAIAPECDGFFLLGEKKTLMVGKNPFCVPSTEIYRMW